MNVRKYIPSRWVLVIICMLSLGVLGMQSAIYREYAVATQECTAVGWTENARLTLELNCEGAKHTTTNGITLKRFVGGETAFVCDVLGDGKVSCSK